MKRILAPVFLLFVFSFADEVLAKKNININKQNIVNKSINIKGGKSSDFSIDPSKPIEIGVTSFRQDGESYLFSVYMINHQAVSGIQLDIQPDDILIIDQVHGGRAESNNFALHYNKSGRILGFSMSGGFIPESNSSEKSENILFNIKATSNSKLNQSIIIEPIFADKNAQRMQFNSIPFQIGK